MKVRHGAHYDAGTVRVSLARLPVPVARDHDPPAALPRVGKQPEQPPRLSWMIRFLLYQVMLRATMASGATGSIPPMCRT